MYDEKWVGLVAPTEGRQGRLSRDFDARELSIPGGRGATDRRFTDGESLAVSAAQSLTTV